MDGFAALAMMWHQLCPTGRVKPGMTVSHGAARFLGYSSCIATKSVVCAP